MARADPGVPFVVPAPSLERANSVDVCQSRARAKSVRRLPPRAPPDPLPVGEPRTKDLFARKD